MASRRYSSPPITFKVIRSAYCLLMVSSSALALVSAAFASATAFPLSPTSFPASARRSEAVLYVASAVSYAVLASLKYCNVSASVSRVLDWSAAYVATACAIETRFVQ